jgi:hypothetical protein
LKLHLCRGAALETFYARFKRLALLRHFDIERVLLLQQRRRNKCSRLAIKSIRRKALAEGFKSICSGRGRCATRYLNLPSHVNTMIQSRNITAKAYLGS